MIPRLTARDVMSTEVVTATVSTPIKDVVRLLDERHVSAVPVLDDGRLAGVLSEGDLMVKQGHADDRRRPGPFALPGTRRVATKVAGTTAGDLMTSPAVTIDPHAGLRRVARTLAEHGVKRLPVVDKDGRLIGIVSRADLIRAYLRPDAEIRRSIEENVFGPLGLDADGRVSVAVVDGVAELRGVLERRSSVELATDLVGGIDGVVDVVNELEYERDDTKRRYASVPSSVPPMRAPF